MGRRRVVSSPSGIRTRNLDLMKVCKLVSWGAAGAPSVFVLALSRFAIPDVRPYESLESVFSAFYR